MNARRRRKKMAKEKQHVFSARTTEEGLRLLNEVKARLGIGWDELVIDAVCDRYGLDRAVMAPPRKDRPAKQPRPTELPPAEETATEQPAATEQLQPADDTPPKKKGKGKSKE
jgi:hypothetical protein